MKYHIEIYVRALGGWIFAHDVTEGEYFHATQALRAEHGNDIKCRLVSTRTVKVRTVVTSDYSEDAKG